ncbi:MAG TPA: glycosyltransferase family 4 protein [Gemmatimonadaceae bacterium]|nr:glycosyltransferase family 4 protein [Gemmatimonadaceae bacterium]
MREERRTHTAREIGYLLTAFPRISETFIASEIHRLERAGVPLRLFTIKAAEPGEREPRHPVVDRIRAVPEILPALTSIRGTSLPRWLVANARAYLRPLGRVATRHPVRLPAAAWMALVQSVRARRAGHKVTARKYAKEMVRAVLLADALDRAPATRHLHAHYCHGTATVAWLATRIRGISFSFTAHARDIYCERLNPAGFLRRKLHAARFAVTCTDANRRHLEQVAGAGAPAVHRIYHGLTADVAALATASAVRMVAPDRLRAIGVGRLIPKKGFDTLVRAVATLRDNGVHADAIIAGPDAGEAETLRTLAAARGVYDAIQFPGAVSQATLVEQFRRATVFCLPCRVAADGDRDGIPNVLVEAMACGLPVIATPVSGIPELIEDGVNGLLVPSDDPDALAAAMLRVHRDQALAARLGAAGRATVRERFDGDVLTRQLASLFAEVA